MEITIYDKMALSQFTSIEKQSMFQLLCGAMMIDGKRDSSEVAIINEISRIMNFTVEEHQASRSLSAETMTKVLRNMDDFKKIYVAKFMAQVILADGIVTSKEEQFFIYMKDMLQLPDVD